MATPPHDNHLIMSTPKLSSASPDQRNLQWKSNNFGAKVLGKMGWKDGEAVGKRQRVAGESASSEGLRIQRRQDGLGVGADTTSNSVNKSDVHQDFLAVLASLAPEGEGAKRKRSSKTKTSKVVSLPTNKTTCHKVRKAKFQEKTAQDLKCIFGAAPSFPVLGNVSPCPDSERKEKAKRKIESKDAGKRKRAQP